MVSGSVSGPQTFLDNCEGMTVQEMVNRELGMDKILCAPRNFERYFELMAKLTYMCNE